MKRYILFAFAGYYPQGGMLDFRGDFDNITEAELAFDRVLDNDEYGDISYAHIFDNQTQLIISQWSYYDNSIWREVNLSVEKFKKRKMDESS